MKLSNKILDISRQPYFRASLMSTLIAAAGAAVANQPGHEHDDKMQSKQQSSVEKRDAKNSQMTRSETRPGSATQETNNPSFSQVDANRDGKLVWTEIYAIYDDELNEANWDQTTAYRTYDVDRNDALSDQEYILFVSGLSDIPSTDIGAQSADAQQKKQQERRQAAEQARQQNMEGKQSRSGVAGTSSQQDQMRQTDQSRNAQAQQQNQDQQQDNLQAQQNNASQQQGSAPVTVLTVTTVTAIPADSLKDMEVINSYGEEIGEVEHVLTQEDGTIDALVVGVGGFWDIGDKDVRVSAEDLRISGDYIVWDTPLNEEQLDNLPEYDRDELSVAY